MNEYPTSLQPESLMAHMRAICKGIGPRPSTSGKEREAADYVEETLRRFGITDIEIQLFKSQNSAGWTTIPSFAAGLLATVIAILGGQWARVISGVLFLGSAYTFRQSVLTIPPCFRRLIARWTSQNVIARIPATGQAERTIYLVGHLDSQKQRFQFPPSQSRVMKTQTTLPIILGALGGVLSLTSALSKRKNIPWWVWPLGIGYLYGLSGALYDETQPHIEGANDNATAVSILLGIARALKAQPLQHTDVVLLFTGCEEVGCVGMERYLEEHAPPTDNTFWIDIEMVGTGELCYVTRHGISYLSTYVPHPRMVDLAEEVARKYPGLGVKGKEMVIIEEISNLRRRDYQAICIAGYNEEGVLPNWHRLSDNLDHIDPDALGRAANYTWELIQEIDR